MQTIPIFTGWLTRYETSLRSRYLPLYNDEISQGYNSKRLSKTISPYQREPKIVYQTYFKLGYDNNYKIIRYDTALAREHFQNQFIEYHMEFFRAGITQIIKLWLKNGCKESPEDMVEIIKSEYRGRGQPLSAGQSAK